MERHQTSGRLPSLRRCHGNWTQNSLTISNTGKMELWTASSVSNEHFATVRGRKHTLLTLGGMPMIILISAIYVRIGFYVPGRGAQLPPSPLPPQDHALLRNYKYTRNTVLSTQEPSETSRQTENFDIYSIDKPTEPFSWPWGIFLVLRFSAADYKQTNRLSDYRKSGNS